MQNFRGDLKWIHQWEGHIGKPYWAKGNSGVTLDPGVDVGYAEWPLVERTYRDLLRADQLEDLRRAAGRRGEAAELFLKEANAARSPLTTIRISRDQADQLFGFVAEPYWQHISSRFPALLRDTTPPTVQTALLSLAYNRGPGNKDLEQLRDPLKNGAWRQVGEAISAMQQNHSLAGIRRRRQEEGKLILQSC